MNNISGYTADPSGPLGKCKYRCSESEHVGNDRYVCLYPDHWDDWEINSEAYDQQTRPDLEDPTTV